MMATYDFITKDARIGPEGNLYLLTFTESTMDRQRPRKDKGMTFPPIHMRIDVIDTKTHEIIRHIEIDGDTRVFSLLNENHIVYVYVDNEGEVIFKWIQYWMHVDTVAHIDRWELNKMKYPKGNAGNLEIQNFLDLRKDAGPGLPEVAKKRLAGLTIDKRKN